MRTGTGDIIGRLCPPSTRRHGIDTSRIEWLTAAPNLRDSLLLRGGADAVKASSRGPIAVHHFAQVEDSRFDSVVVRVR